MRPPSEWTEADIQSHIDNQVEESLHLDYKAAKALANTDGKKTDISKDVSSFANSDGGVLVYGISENGRFPAGIDPIDPKEISREWLEQVINGNIQRRIDGIRIQPIQIAGPSGGKVVFVVDVPQSPAAPHQAADKRYYKRFNFQAVPMEDYEVRDVANRRRNPVVSGLFELPSHSRIHNRIDGSFSLTLKNYGQVLADRVYLELMVPSGIMDNTVRFPGKDRERRIVDGIEYSVFKYHHPHSIFPGENATVLDGNELYIFWKVDGPWFKDNYDHKITCKVFADNAEPQITTKTLNEVLPLKFQAEFPINFKPSNTSII